MNILIIIGSIREARATPRVAKWVEKAASARLTDHTVTFVDLKELELPFFDEPLPPLGNPDRVVGDKAAVWLQKLDQADAVVFVTPEYNHGIPAPLKNALDFVDRQLMRKPTALVGHGVNGAARSIEQLRSVLGSNIGSIVIPEAIAINGAIGKNELITENGDANSEIVERAQAPLEKMLDSLAWYADALKAKRG